MFGSGFRVHRAWFTPLKVFQETCSAVGRRHYQAVKGNASLSLLLWSASGMDIQSSLDVHGHLETPLFFVAIHLYDL